MSAEVLNGGKEGFGAGASDSVFQRTHPADKKTSGLNRSQPIGVPRSNTEQEPKADEMGLVAGSVPVGDQAFEGEAKCSSGCPIESGWSTGSNWWRGKLERVVIVGVG